MRAPGGARVRLSRGPCPFAGSSRGSSGFAMLLRRMAGSRAAARVSRRDRRRVGRGVERCASAGEREQMAEQDNGTQSGGAEIFEQNLIHQSVDAQMSGSLEAVDYDFDLRNAEVVPPSTEGTAVAPARDELARRPQAGYQSDFGYLRPLPRVLMLHTGGTLGMDPRKSYEDEGMGNVHLKQGTGGVYQKGLQPGAVLSDLLSAVPELSTFAHLDVSVLFNLDSCRIGPKQWLQLAKLLHQNRQNYDAFLIVHGTDTMSFTAAALSLMLAGFKKPIVLTGSQLPLAMSRSDARQNLIDAITCATSNFSNAYSLSQPVNFQEVAICFGGKLMRGNRARKMNSSVYAAFETPMYPNLADLGVEIGWNHGALHQTRDLVYNPRLKLNPNVIRVPIVPGVDPRKAYGDLYGRGVRGIVLEVFGVGNMPDQPSQGWIPWLKQQRKKGLMVYLCSQCQAGDLHPELYRAGSMAMGMGVESGRQMTPECAVVKMMLCLEYPDIPLSQPIAGEL